MCSILGWFSVCEHKRNFFIDIVSFYYSSFVGVCADWFLLTIHSDLLDWCLFSVHNSMINYTCIINIWKKFLIHVLNVFRYFSPKLS